MLNIPLIYTAELSCMTSPVISFMAYKKLNYELAFLQSWGFSFVEEDKKYPGALGPRIWPGKDNVFECLTVYYNVKFKEYQKISKKKIYSIIKKNISKGMPVIIHTDFYNCSWSKLYRKEHLNHACMVAGLDDTGNLYCIDAAPLNNGAFMQLQDFFEGTTGCFEIDFDGYKNNLFDWPAVLQRAISQIHSENTFPAISEFIACFETGFNVEAEILTCPHSPENAYINWKIQRIAGGRELFSLTIKHIGERYGINDLLSLSERLIVVSDGWKQVQLLINKSFYSPDNKNIIGKISGTLKSLLEKEEKIADDILKICGSVV